MIKLINIDEDVQKSASILLYGESGIGKTTTIKTLPTSSPSRVVYVGADPGHLSLLGFNCKKAKPENGQWNRKYLLDLYEYIRDNSNQFDWIVIDGLDDLGDAILQGEKRETTNLQKAYGEMADFMREWTLAIRDLDGTNPLLITHIAEERDSVGNLSFYPSFPGKAFTGRIKDFFDFVGCMRMVQTEEGQKRMIQFRREADPRFAVKERGNIVDALEEPHLGKILDKLTKAGVKAINDAPKQNRSKIKELSKLMKEKGVTLEMIMVKFGPHPKDMDDKMWTDMVTWVSNENK